MFTTIVWVSDRNLWYGTVLLHIILQNLRCITYFKLWYAEYLENLKIDEKNEEMWAMNTLFRSDHFIAYH